RAGRPRIRAMKVIETALPGCLVIEPQVFGDARGQFFESFNNDKLAEYGLEPRFVQGNVSTSARGVLRGLHYQWPKPQGKYVSVLDGEVWDVAVDIRRGSPTFGKWEAVLLTAGNRRHFWIPEGFAHGLAVLSEKATFTYLCTETYERDAGAGRSPAGLRALRILLLGANGQVGTELQRSLAPLGEVVAATRDGRLKGGTACGVADFDDPAGLGTLVAKVAPDVVVNGAAYTAVDRAESEPEAAFRANAQAPAAIAEACAARNALLV